MIKIEPMKWFFKYTLRRISCEAKKIVVGVGWGAVICVNHGWGPHLLYYLRTLSINFPFLYEGANGIILKNYNNKSKRF